MLSNVKAFERLCQTGYSNKLEADRLTASILVNYDENCVSPETCAGRMYFVRAHQTRPCLLAYNVFGIWQRGADILRDIFSPRLSTGKIFSHHENF